jgi:hypothetical protein
MTTFYAYHWLIEPVSTSDTIVLAFGGWWEVEEAVTTERFTPPTAQQIDSGGMVGTIYP